MTRYSLGRDILGNVREDGVFKDETIWIPKDDLNDDWASYLRWLEANAEPSPGPAPPVAKDLGAAIRDWQFYSILALEGVISAEEALATSSGALPQLLTDAINYAVPDPNARLVATMKVRNTTDFYRRDDMVALVAMYLTNLGTHGVWDEARLDGLWASARALT